MQALVESISDHIAPALLVICRIGGLMIFAPVLASIAIPAQIRVAFTFIVGLAAYPLLARETLPPVPLELDLWALAPLVLLEVLVGMVIGWLALLPLMGVQTGSKVMGQQLGLAFSQIYNPASDSTSDVLGQFLFWAAMAGFLLIGGLEHLMISVMHSFEYIPLGGMRIDQHLLDVIVGMLMAAFELGLRVAVPVLALVFLESVAMGFMAKTTPQINILSLGFPIRILSGITMVMLGLYIIDDVMIEAIDDGLVEIHVWATSGIGS